MYGINYTANYRQYYQKNNSQLKIVFLVLSFLLFMPFPAGNTIIFTPSEGTNRKKYSYKLQHQSQIADSGGK